MLVLSRKKNESIVINDNITITVVEIRGSKVRLGIDAPKEVPVHRREVFDAIRRETEVVLMLKSSPERVEKIRRLRKDGVPLWRIEQMFDAEDNETDG